MSEALFRLPSTIRFGFGVSSSIADAARELGARRLMIVSDAGVVRAGIVDGPIDLLTAAVMEAKVFADVSANPRDFECLRAAEVAREWGADAIIAIGGGSPIDLAKTAAGLATNAGLAQDWEAPRTFDNPPLPLIAVPTTAGTGSEVTRSSVIIDTARQIKFTVRDSQIAPRIALVDPGLTLSLPPAVTAATGMDALTHAIEAYTCRRASPITDALALQAIRMIAPNLLTAVRDGQDRGARDAMMMASVIAGMAFSNSDVASVHCIAEAIGGRYDTPHGVANSLFLPWLFAFNAETDPERHAVVARALGVVDDGQSELGLAQRGAQWLASMARDIGIPTLTELPGIEPESFPWIAAAAVANGSNGSNARPMTEADYLLVLERAWVADDRRAEA